MNAADVLMYGDRTWMGTLAGLPDPNDERARAIWEAGGVCGVWSAKDVVSHLASFELVLLDVLKGFTDGGPTPHLDEYVNGGPGWNDRQVDRRKGMTPPEALAEYREAHAQVMARIGRVQPETLRQPATLPWYGNEYALDDYLVYAFYGHKREHSAQIAVYLDVLRARQASGTGA